MNDKQNYSIYGKGYYFALLLCAAAIGITSFFYYRSTGTEQPDAQVVSGTLAPEKEDVAAIATKPKDAPQPTQAQEPAGRTPKALTTCSPVAGETVFDYSVEVLSYNETTRDWRTHNGIDIAAKAGTEVVAAADGVVYTTYEDDSLGYTVVIRHEGGYTTHYSSLDEALLVKAGDNVTMGQVIGTVDSTALVETVLGPHVHFSVTYQDAPMDPAEFFSLG